MDLSWHVYSMPFIVPMQFVCCFCICKYQIAAKTTHNKQNTNDLQQTNIYVRPMCLYALTNNTNNTRKHKRVCVLFIEHK